ncbi:MAG: hypothetical protein FDZ69_11065 [Deltaproteobacteria bacterium]|nr:MAG: hypothetical protein FDZ69_11065 [Deltaproteobacteria bacterium]
MQKNNPQEHNETTPKRRPVLTPPSRLKDEFNISRSKGLMLENDPTSGFPKRIKIHPGGKMTAWITEELEEYFRNQPRIRTSSDQ